MRYELIDYCVAGFTCPHQWSLQFFLSLFLGVMSTHVRPCMYVLACVWVNPGPPAHFTRRQTSKAFWINPACRGRSACHPQFHISAAPAAPNLHAHSYWNEQMEFCHAANRHPSLRKDKTSKERRYIGICFSRWWGCVSSQVEWRCSVCLWKCGQSASIVFFLIKAGQLCLHYSSLAKAGSLSPWLDTAEMMSWSRAHAHTHRRAHRYKHQSICGSPLLTHFINP